MTKYYILSDNEIEICKFLLQQGWNMKEYKVYSFGHPEFEDPLTGIFHSLHYANDIEIERIKMENLKVN